MSIFDDLPEMSAEEMAELKEKVKKYEISEVDEVEARANPCDFREKSRQIVLITSRTNNIPAMPPGELDPRFTLGCGKLVCISAIGRPNIREFYLTRDGRFDTVRYSIFNSQCSNDFSIQAQRLTPIIRFCNISGIVQVFCSTRIALKFIRIRFGSNSKTITRHPQLMTSSSSQLRGLCGFRKSRRLSGIRYSRSIS